MRRHRGALTGQVAGACCRSARRFPAEFERWMRAGGSARRRCHHHAGRGMDRRCQEIDSAHVRITTRSLRQELLIGNRSAPRFGRLPTTAIWEMTHWPANCREIAPAKVEDVRLWEVATGQPGLGLSPRRALAEGLILMPVKACRWALHEISRAEGIR